MGTKPAPRKRRPIDLARLRARDPALLESLVRELSPRLLAVIRGYARDDNEADDLLQESWIRILERLDSYKALGSFAGWAAMVTRNVCRTSLRRRATVDRVEVAIENVGELPDGTPEEEQPAAQLRLRTALFKALDGLPDRERQAIVLRVIEERSPDEVADILGVSQETVRSLVRRGLDRMRRMKAVGTAVAAWMEEVS